MASQFPDAYPDSVMKHGGELEKASNTDAPRSLAASSVQRCPASAAQSYDARSGFKKEGTAPPGRMSALPGQSQPEPPMLYLSNGERKRKRERERDGEEG